MPILSWVNMGARVSDYEGDFIDDRYKMTEKINLARYTVQNKRVTYKLILDRWQTYHVTLVNIAYNGVSYYCV